MAENKRTGLLAKIKGILGPVKLSTVEALALAELKFGAEAELENGTKIGTDAGEWATGVAAFVTGADGAVAPAPAGEHVTKDGKTIVVDETGMVTEIKEKAVEQEEDITIEQVQEIAEDAAKALRETTDELNTEKTAHEAAKTDLVSHKATIAERDKKIKELEAQVLTLSKKAGVPSLKETKKENFSQDKTKPASVKDRVLSTLDAVSN